METSTVQRSKSMAHMSTVPGTHVLHMYDMNVFGTYLFLIF